MKHPIDSKSFTLIELLIAIFILAVGIVGVLQAFPLGTRIASFSKMSTVATQLAQAKIEDMISGSYFDLSSSLEGYGEIPGFESYKRATAVDYYDPVTATTTGSDTGIKKIEITVFFKSPLGVSEKEVKITSLISRR